MSLNEFDFKCELTRRSKIMKFSIYYYLLIVSVVLLFITSAICSLDEREDDEEPRRHYTIGSFFEVESFYNETNTKNKLRLSKSFVKHKISSVFHPAPLVAFKVKYLEELLRCENLTLDREDHKEMIDCKPLEEHFMDDSYTSTGSNSPIGNYVRRSLLRTKSKNPFAEHEKKLNYYSYPLKSEVIDENMKMILQENELEDLGFSKPPLTLGYHVQVTLNTTSQTTVTCSTDLFVSVNRTEIFARLSNDPYPEFADEMDYLIDQGMKNGYLFSVRNVECKDKNMANLLSLDMKINMNFTIIQRRQFPYLSVRHTFKVFPMEAFLKYEASVKQIRTGRTSYNTSVDINCLSGFFPILNFKLDQVFMNNDSQVGTEKMSFIHPNAGAIKVHSIWTKESFAKIVTFFLLEKDQEDVVKDVHESIEFLYSDLESHDDVLLNLKIKKHLIRALAGKFESFLNLDDVSVTGGTQPLEEGQENESTDEMRDEL